ncbi:MAG: alpha-glucuronidase [Defluviitaleaceae bacterium]|nr:alpha-glucuronidase [Defluviitaleaceae bacterium]
MLHDNCWLDKKSVSHSYKSYCVSLPTDSSIGETLHNEVGYFWGSAPTTPQGAELVFELLEQQKAETLDIGLEGYSISHSGEKTIVAARGEVGLLYGFFALIRQLQQGQMKDAVSAPKNKLRIINHWDNISGKIERGYAGDSIFYKDDKFIKDKTAVWAYARMLASVGLNFVAINNVNVHDIETGFIKEPFLTDVAEVANIFRKYGIRLLLSVNFAAPVWLGEMDTADPLDSNVGEWWSNVARVIYKKIPDFGGFVVKADSEHRPGPFFYGRNHVDGANMLATALEPFGGLVFWRCFVYNCTQDWRDRTIDRAKAAYDHFMPLDGQFKENVVLQIKNGPMDFQVREATSPLLGALKKTNHILEFQVAHEYTGHAKHIFFLPKSWEEILNFDTKTDLKDSTIAGVLQSYPKENNPHSGMVAVCNIGNDHNFTGHKLSQVNLFGYGLLTWDPAITAKQIAGWWVAATFNLSKENANILEQILLSSPDTYENYTAPLGVGWMVNIHTHYGPAVNGYEFDRWGTYHFSDRNGMGVDRTVKSGSGYTQQYQKQNYEMYENIETCPDELLLFFHHVPYTHKLKSGKTVIQHIYDTHFAGVEAVEQYIKDWEKLQSEIDETSYKNVADRLDEQLASSREWCDQINTYYYRMSGIEDAHGRTIYR